jgi:ergothioneine biosynthesis protein EgtB
MTGAGLWWRHGFSRGPEFMAMLSERYLQTRRFTEQLCKPLAVEDFVVQSMPDASPTRWHLAHTTWFFETFLLARWERDYRPAQPAFEMLFNSYYNNVGRPFPRHQRGLLTRPTVAEVFEYRKEVDRRVMALMQSADTQHDEIANVVELGINHEQQHQELILTDIKHMFACNPLWPTYCQSKPPAPAGKKPPDGWSAHEGKIVEIGHAGPSFSFDNEGPRHRVLLQPFEIHNRLVTVDEYLKFINDSGYSRPELWLSLGWATVVDHKWSGPMYWTQRDGQWHQFTLGGLRPLDPDEPVCHVSFFEADAFARWRGVRLPTEFEWEHAAKAIGIGGSFAESEHFHPQPPDGDAAGLGQWYGEVWQWTASPYMPYPGFVPPAGALGEYNGKFMCNQYVLRGASCATPKSHVRVTYRNFFPPDARWQFTGIRLARDVH